MKYLGYLGLWVSQTRVRFTFGVTTNLGKRVGEGKRGVWGSQNSFLQSYLDAQLVGIPVGWILLVVESTLQLSPLMDRFLHGVWHFSPLFPFIFQYPCFCCISYLNYYAKDLIFSSQVLFIFLNYVISCLCISDINWVEWRKKAIVFCLIRLPLVWWHWIEIGLKKSFWRYCTPRMCKLYGSKTNFYFLSSVSFVVLISIHKLKCFSGR